MNEPLVSAPIGLILAGYALGLTVALVVIAARGGSTAPPTVVLEREREDGGVTGCLPVLLVLGVLLLVIAASVELPI